MFKALDNLTLEMERDSSETGNKWVSSKNLEPATIPHHNRHRLHRVLKILNPGIKSDKLEKV